MNYFSKIATLLFLFVFISGTFGAIAKNFPNPSNEELQFDKELFHLRSKIAFSNRINPTTKSQNEEKQNFFSALKNGSIYNPIFSYNSLTADIIKASEKKLSISGKSLIKNLLNECSKQLTIQAKMLSTDDSQVFTENSIKLYPAPENWLILEALLIIKNQKQLNEEKIYSPEELKKLLMLSLADYGLDNWKVVISDGMGARASVSPAKKQIKINSGARFSELDAKRLALHEIGVHAVRAENGSKKELKIFTTGFPGYVETEEGLAVFNEVKHEIKIGLPLFALRVLGVHWSLTNSFHKTFLLLKQAGASNEIAWRITTRCKRGLRNTFNKGAYTKDVSYLRGYFKIKNAEKSDNSIFPALLKLGKVSLKAYKEMF